MSNLSNEEILVKLFEKRGCEKVNVEYLMEEVLWTDPTRDTMYTYKVSKGEQEIEEVFEEDNFLFYEGIEGLVTDCDKNAFRFYHLQGTHIPFTITADFQNTGTETSIREEARGMMVLIEKFLEKMKRYWF